MSIFKIKPLKALATENTLPSPPRKKAIFNYRSFLTANEQHFKGGGRGGIILAQNPRDGLGFCG